MLLLARARLHVAAVALRAAVLVVVTAHRLEGRRRTDPFHLRADKKRRKRQSFSVKI